MMRLLTALVLLSVGLPGALSGQAVADSAQVPVRIATITAGIGNAMGWFGLQGERYFSGDRLSAFLGVGYTPAPDEIDPSGSLRERGFGISHAFGLTGDRFQVLYHFTMGGPVDDPRLQTHPPYEHLARAQGREVPRQ